MLEFECTAQLALGRCARHVHFSSEDDNRDDGQHIVRHQPVKLEVRLRESRAVGQVDEKDDAVDTRVVVAPDLAGGRVAAEVERAEADAADGHLLRCRLLGWRVLRHTAGAQEVQEGRFAGVVEAEEEEFRVFVIKACVPVR